MAKHGSTDTAGDYLAIGALGAVVAVIVFTADATIGSLLMIPVLLLILVAVIAKGVEIGLLAADRVREEQRPQDLDDD